MANFHLQGLINNEKLSDVCFVINCNLNDNSLDPENNTLWANRAILAYNSPVFKAMLYGPMKEGDTSNKQPIEIIDIPYEAFNCIIEYIYTGSIRNIKGGLCIPVLYGAKKYQIESLWKKCNDVFLSNATCDDIYLYIHILLEKTPWSYQDEFIELCSSFIMSNGDEFLKSNKFIDLPRKFVIDVIQSDSLLVSSEVVILKAVNKWIKKHELKTDSNTKLKKLYSYIRFTNMTVEELCSDVFNSDIFSPDELLNIIQYTCLREFSLLSSINTNIEPRIPIGIIKYIFTYEKDFDKNGVIYHLGTPTNGEFVNPMENETIRICSTETNTALKSHCIITSRKLSSKGWIGSSNIWSCSDTPWISIDFGPHRKLNITSYTLLHSWPTSLDSLRSWVIEGCNPDDNLGQAPEDREVKEAENIITNDPHVYTQYREGYSYNESKLEWIIIHEKKDDNSLNYGWARKTWKVKNNSSFRMIRIRSTGPDSSGTKYLTLGGIEFYGVLFIYEKINSSWDY